MDSPEETGRIQSHLFSTVFKKQFMYGGETVRKCKAASRSGIAVKAVNKAALTEESSNRRIV